MSVMTSQELSGVENSVKLVIKNESSNSQAAAQTASSITTTTASSHVSKKKDKGTYLLNFFLET